MNKALLIVGLIAGCARTTVITAPESTSKEIFTEISKSSVVLETDHGLGSGTVVWTDGDNMSLVLTCHHVAFDTEENKPHLEISISSAQGGNAAGVVEMGSETSDLALVLAIGNLNAPALPIAKKEPELYEHLYVMGSPAGYRGTAAEAILTSKEGFWQLTSFIFPGYSGGTVANNRLELVAVPRMVYASVNPYGVPEIVPELGFVVPLPMIRTFLKDYPGVLTHGRR